MAGMLLPALQIPFILSYASSLISKMIRQRIKMSRLKRLMPCMYFTKLPFGLFGSFLRSHKYSEICFQIPIITKLQ